MKYNYVFYGATSFYTGAGFLKTSFQEMDALENAVVRGDFLESDNRLLQLLFKLHTYPQFNRFIEIPWKSIWTKHCFKFTFRNNNPICFIFEVKYFDQDYFFDVLKRRFPGCKFVITFRDLYERKKQQFSTIDINTLHKKFDLVMSYDKGDCEKYGMTYFNLEASMQPLKIAKDYPWSDVIFIGRAKGRTDRIIKAYDILSAAGLKCFFYVVGEQNIKQHGDIIFTNRIMPYQEMLEHTMNSRCVLELSQVGEYGFTSRSQEAIMYNKKLITDSLIVREQKFYPSKDILFISNVDEINPDFVKDQSEVNYGYDGEYSPVRLLENIESHLNAKDFAKRII